MQLSNREFCLFTSAATVAVCAWIVLIYTVFTHSFEQFQYYLFMCVILLGALPGLSVIYAECVCVWTSCGCCLPPGATMTSSYLYFHSISYLLNNIIWFWFVMYTHICLCIRFCILSMICKERVWMGGGWGDRGPRNSRKGRSYVWDNFPYWYAINTWEHSAVHAAPLTSESGPNVF